jgi:hypothetical protein
MLTIGDLEMKIHELLDSGADEDMPIRMVLCGNDYPAESSVVVGDVEAEESDAIMYVVCDLRGKGIEFRNTRPELAYGPGTTYKSDFDV